MEDTSIRKTNTRRIRNPRKRHKTHPKQQLNTKTISIT